MNENSDIEKEVAQLKLEKVISEQTAQIYLKDLKEKMQVLKDNLVLDEELDSLQKQTIISEQTAEIYVKGFRGRFSENKSIQE